MKKPVVYVASDDRSADFAQWQGLVQGLSAACASAGMKLSVLTQEGLMGLAQSAGDPVILTGTDVTFLRQAVKALRAGGRRAVLAGLDAEQLGEDISCAAPSRRAETQQLVGYLYACGRTRLALVGFGAHSVNDQLRFHAAMEAIAALGLPISQQDAWLWQRDPNACFRAFLAQAQRYDAVICPNDVLAICLVNACAAAGIKVPDDLYVASFGNTRIGRLYTPSITTMTMDMPSVGAQAFAAWQFVRADASGQAVCKITVPSRILVRESTAGRLIPAPRTPVPPMPEDPYYRNPVVMPLEAIERCLAHLDGLDLRILARLVDGTSYEDICDELFLSSGSLRYRLNRIYASLDVPNRRGMEALIRAHFGRANPFLRALNTDALNPPGAGG